MLVASGLPCVDDMSGRPPSINSADSTAPPRVPSRASHDEPMRDAAGKNGLGDRRRADDDSIRSHSMNNDPPRPDEPLQVDVSAGLPRNLRVVWKRSCIY